MMKHLLFFLMATFPFTAFSQSCDCGTPREKLYSYNTLGLCAVVKDSAAKEMIIGKFTLCNKDSVVMDRFNNEGASFFLQKLPTGVSLIEIDLKIEKGKLVYPINFKRTNILLMREKVIVLTNDTPAKPIVLYLQQHFKKFRKLY